MVQADLMSMGRLFLSRGAAAMKDRSPIVTFVKRFGVLRRIPLLFRRNKDLFKIVACTSLENKKRMKSNIYNALVDVHSLKCHCVTETKRPTVS